VTSKEASEEERRYPFLWRFWQNIPAEGQIAVYHKAWYDDVLGDILLKQKKKKQLQYYIDEINQFEQQLTDNGVVVIKFFACITKKEQKKRFTKLLENKDTAWRVSEKDKKQNKNFDKYYDLCENVLTKTNTTCAPWYVLETEEKDRVTAEMMTILVNRLERELNRTTIMKPVRLPESTAQPLSQVDLSKDLTKEEYKAKLKELQKRIRNLHNEIYENKIPVVFAFEGWDAGGKGGAIKRLTESMDPRGYVVHPVASPTPVEKSHHYLWRFWKNIPKNGHIAVFDRTWYGRVMVERLEGFCTEDDWKRAYREINQFEKTLAEHGTVVVKFWMQIDKDEQKRRFDARQENPEKRWKITDEDWRNREKWDQYEVAVNEMIARTDRTYAPWVIVEGNSKYYARIKVLETAIDAMEAALKKKANR
jgi:polyphosphate:AMP phosphotransferase